jgi:type 1 fimbria pilin
MRSFVLKIAIATGALCIAPFAQAQTTTFNITGTITMGTCTIAVNSGANVDVGSFNASVFTGSYTSGYKNFNVAVSNCAPGITKITLKPTGTADQTPGGNVAYWNSRLPGAPFELNDQTPNANLPPSGATSIVINNPSTNATPTNRILRAQFHQTAALVPGSIGAGSATVTLAVTYN